MIILFLNDSRIEHPHYKSRILCIMFTKTINDFNFNVSNKFEMIETRSEKLILKKS